MPLTPSVLHVEELDHAEPSHQQLRETWQATKSRIDRAAHSPAFPSFFLLSNDAGFLQLVDSASGTFRVYCMLVANVPCDVGPRCLAIDASRSVVGRGGHPSGLGAVFALAYSPALCRVELDTGVVHELHNFEARPSAVCAETDFIAAGDGRGDVCLWRASDPTVPMLWHKRQLASKNTDVTAISIARDAVFVGLADYSVRVLCVYDGAVQATLLSEGYSAVKGVAPLLPYSDDVVVGNNRGMLTVWRPSKRQASSRTAGDGRPPVAFETADADRAPPRSNVLTSTWTVRSVANAFPVSTLSFRNGYVVVGGSDGRLAVFAATEDYVDGAAAHIEPRLSSSFDALKSKPLAGALKMVVCYDLEHAIIAGHVTDDASLCAVTQAGDVWRWPLSDVLAPSAEEDVADESREHVPEADRPPATLDTTVGSRDGTSANTTTDIEASADRLARQMERAASVGREAAPTALNASPEQRLPDTPAGSMAFSGAPDASVSTTRPTGTEAGADDDRDSLADAEDAADVRRAAAAGLTGGAAADDTAARRQSDVVVVDMDLDTPPDGCLTEITASSTRPRTGTAGRPTDAAADGDRPSSWALPPPPQRAPQPAPDVGMPRPTPATFRHAEEGESVLADQQQAGRWTTGDLPSSVHLTRASDATAATSKADAGSRLGDGGATAGVNVSVQRPATADATGASPVPDASMSAAPQPASVGPPLPSPRPVLPAVEIDGLLSGRRMDRRAARVAADRYDRFVSSNVAEAVGDDTSPSRHVLAVAVADGSSRMLRHELHALAQGADRDAEASTDDAAAVAARDDTAFDLALRAISGDTDTTKPVDEDAVDEYIAKNRTAADALAFANPIKPFMSFDREEVVFRGVGMTRPAHERPCRSPPEEEGSPRGAQQPQPAGDDLAPATVASGFARRRDKRFEKERAAVAPALSDHLCHDLLVPPAGAAFFFDVFHTELKEPEPFIEPLPCPAPPTVT